MKIAIVYESKSGNTEILAKAIYDMLENCDVEICNIEEDEIPEADFYFIGFGIHNQTCSMNIAEKIENISNARYALFLTCGFAPTTKYKEKIYKNIEVWLPEEADLVDIFLCQGKVGYNEQLQIINKSPDSENIIREMFLQGESHPNDDDIQYLVKFVKKVLSID